MSADPIAELDRLLVDDPAAAELDAVLDVAGDLLQSQGHWRGELIAREQALRRAASRAERAAARTELERWLDGRERTLFGETLGSLRRRRGALRYAFLGGRLRELFIDLRRILPPELAHLDAEELLRSALLTPKLRYLRRLQLRVRRREDLISCARLVDARAEQLHLEQLVLAISTRPTSHLPAARADDRAIERFPSLWLRADLRGLTPLLDPRVDDPTSARAIEALDLRAPSRRIRVFVGRALSSNRPLTTVAAIEALGALGPSGRVFLPTLRLLLRPGVSPVLAELLPALVALPAWGRALAPDLRRLTGDPHFSAEIRSLAGRAAHQLGASV